MRHRTFLLGNNWLVVYLTFISSFAPLSTDMYLPALPHMAENLNASYELTSLTVSGFLLVFGVSMLLWGPLSDKYGRKPVLFCGSLLYVLSSVAIPLCSSIGALLVWRGLQGLGSGAVSAMSLAVVKDILRGKTLEKVVAWIQTMHVLAPILAPVLGGWILLVIDWRGVFWMLALLGLVAFSGAFCLRETCPPQHRTPGPLIKALGRLFVVLRQRNFAWPLLLFSTMSMPFMAYLAVSAHVFQSVFGLSPQQFSLFFAGNAAVSMLGPILHMRFFRSMRRRRVIACHLATSCLCGILLWFFGGTSAAVFAALYLPITFCGAAMRPPATVLMMESVKGDNGAVTALISAGALLFGSCSMFLAALPVWGGMVSAAGGISTLVSCSALAGWIALLRLGIVPIRRK